MRSPGQLGHKYMSQQDEHGMSSGDRRLSSRQWWPWSMCNGEQNFGRKSKWLAGLWKMMLADWVVLLRIPRGRHLGDSVVVGIKGMM